jgi:hypothetical protein
MCEWTENDKGNYIYKHASDVMTVFKKNGSEDWSGVYDGKFLKGSYDTANEAQKAMERFVFNDESKLAKAPTSGWQETKKGGYYKRTANGISTVKQASSGKWYITTNQGTFLEGCWFDTADEAKRKANAFA